MPIKKLSRNSAAWAFAGLIAAIVGVAVAFRSDGVGSDTSTYRARFLSLVSGVRPDTGFDPAFELLMKLAGMSGSVEVFFGSVYACLLTAMIWAVRNTTTGITETKSNFVPIAGLGLLLFSSWFITGSLNGLRQGLSLGVFFLGITLIFFQNRWVTGAVFVAIAPLFHLSTVLLWPVVALYPFVSLWMATVLFVVSGAAYSLGIWELIILNLSALTGVDAHAWITRYARYAQYRYGWQWDLFAYTVGMAGIHLIGRLYVPADSRRGIDSALKIYLLLCLPYFILGFGNFSNRFGTMAWSFLPILHATWLFQSKLDSRVIAIIAMLLLAGGVTRYSLFLIGIP